MDCPGSPPGASGSHSALCAPGWLWAGREGVVRSMGQWPRGSVYTVMTLMRIICSAAFSEKLFVRECLYSTLKPLIRLFIYMYTSCVYGKAYFQTLILFRNCLGDATVDRNFSQSKLMLLPLLGDHSQFIRLSSNPLSTLGNLLSFFTVYVLALNAIDNSQTQRTIYVSLVFVLTMLTEKYTFFCVWLLSQHIGGLGTSVPE